MHCRPEAGSGAAGRGRRGCGGVEGGGQVGGGGGVQVGGSAAGTGPRGVGIAAQSIRHAAPATAGSRRGPAAQPHSCDAAKRLGHSCHKLRGSELRRGLRGRRTMRDCTRPHGHTGGAWGAPACAVEAEVEQPTHDSPRAARHESPARPKLRSNETATRPHPRRARLACGIRHQRSTTCDHNVTTSLGGATGRDGGRTAAEQSPRARQSV